MPKKKNLQNETWIINVQHRFTFEQMYFCVKAPTLKRAIDSIMCYYDTNFFELGPGTHIMYQNEIIAMPIFQTFEINL